MLRADYHVHSNYSFDGKADVAEQCAAAVRENVAELCFTEHVDLHHPTPICRTLPDFPAWLDHLAQARKRFPSLVVRTGLEVGDNAPHRAEIQALVKTLPLDFCLLSLHLVDDVDCYEPAFFAEQSQATLYRRYAELKLESALHFEEYDAIAHLGYCGKFAPYPPEERPLRWRHAPDHIDALLAHIAHTGRALEINTSGLKQMSVAIPGPDILRRFAELGGEFVVLGSDAHAPEFVGYRLEEAREMALEAGIRWGVTYVAHEPTPYALEG